MKRCLPLLLALCLAFSLAASGSGEEPAAGQSQPVSSQAEASQPEVSQPDASQPEEPQEEPAPALGDGEKEAARQAALDYYAGTVFEVLDLTETDPGEGEIAFRVACAKEGTPVDPDRTITLARQESVWTVVNEGY